MADPIVLPLWYRDRIPPETLARQIESARQVGIEFVFADRPGAGYGTPGPPVGTIVHGFCGGAFGRDSYACRQIEAAGADWIVTRTGHGEVEFSTHLALVAQLADDRSYCSRDCTG